MMIKSALHSDMQLTQRTDYGRSKGVAYYYLGGFGIVHDQAAATESRIVVWDTAA